MSGEMTFDYINHRGEFSRRRARPVSYRYGSSDWHPNPQWLMMAIDVEKNEPREFAMMDMTNVEYDEKQPPNKRGDGSYQSPLRDLIMRIDMVAQNHLSYSQACNAVSHLREHLSALARCEEINRETGKTVVLAE